jgi:NTP pyrophosphatase (non-canonical NTP hydrolase)
MNLNYSPTQFSGKLAYLIEECGEVLAAAGKTARFGRDSYNPELPKAEQESNEEWLLREINDLKYAISILEDHIINEGTNNE